MATEQTQQQTQQPLPLDNPAPQPQQQAQTADNTPAVKKDNAPAKTKAVDKSLVIASIKKLPPILAPIANCFDNAWDGFVKAYGKDAGQVMAREIDFATQALINSNYLLKVATDNPLSLVSALKNLAHAGFTLNPVLKQAYLVPIGGAVVFVPSYMGMIDILVSSGIVKKIEAHPVFKGEPFKITFGTNGGLFHEPNPWGKRDKESLCGCYWYAVLVDGTEQFDTLSFAEVESIRKRAPSAKSSSPWDTDYMEMLCKTAIRRGYKKIPKKGISEDKLKALGAVFDYDEKAEQSWIAEQKHNPKRDTFDEEEVEYEDLSQ